MKTCYNGLVHLLLQVRKITGTTADVFLEYIQRNLPEGVTMSVYQVRDLFSVAILFDHIAVSRAWSNALRGCSQVVSTVECSC